MPAPTSSLLVGVDGGASGFRAHAVVRQAKGLACQVGRQIERHWSHPQGFSSLPLGRQLEQASELAARNPSCLGDREQEAARGEVHALLDALDSLCGARDQPLRVGLCMPGLRTKDLRGIAVRRHGPRSPSLLADLKAGCEGRGIELAARIPDLRGDGWAATLGEDVAVEGQLSDVGCAYYVGAGTGLAEGLKWEGAHLDLGRFRDYLPAPWSTATAGGRTWEDAVALGGLQHLWEQDGEGLVFHAAVSGDPKAQCILAEGARALGGWLLKRMDELLLWDGRVVECIVIGQRSGELLADERADPWYRNPLHETLETGLRTRQDTAMTIHALDAGTLRPGFLRASRLREAPALGMAACAEAESPHA